MTTDNLIKWSTVLAVAAVAIVAGWVSYVHALDVVTAHGEHGALAHLYPGTIDGLIYSASMVLLDAARRDVKAPRLAYWLLGVGITVTLVANVLAGVAFGVLGAVVAAWPALALVGSYELLMAMIRRSRTVAEADTADVYPALDDTAQAVADVPVVPVPADSQSAAVMALRATLAAGNPLSGRQLETRFGLTRAEVTRVREMVTVESNGHLAEGNGQVDHG
jgi:hypothetical protein